MPASDDADVAIKPPFLFLGALALGCCLSLVLPIGPDLASPNGLAFAVGLIFVAIGLALGILAIRRFRLAGTSVVPGEPSTALVVDGPIPVHAQPDLYRLRAALFRACHHPDQRMGAALLIPVLIVLQRGVVEREEVYLQRQFGDAYRKYQARVPRWL